MDTQTIKQGDFVRLTDPLDNGTIVRIENVDENGFAEWLGGSQYCDMEQIDLIDVNSDLIYYYHSLSELVRHIEEKTGIKLYPESAVNYWKHRAETAEQENALNDKLLKEEHNKLLDVQYNIEKLQSELRRCRIINAHYLSTKTETENKVKILEQENADSKVHDSRRERHLRDELHKVRIECQQAWEYANEEMKENKELSERNAALKLQLDESNKQIEIYAQKVRNLEAELEEDGGLG